MAGSTNGSLRTREGVPAAHKQTRAQRGKSRSGCQRCKLRHLKCDETVPECTNCTRRGYECPGSTPRVRFSRKHERYLPSSQISSNSTAVPCTRNDAHQQVDSSPASDIISVLVHDKTRAHATRGSDDGSSAVCGSDSPVARSPPDSMEASTAVSNALTWDSDRTGPEAEGDAVDADTHSASANFEQESGHVFMAATQLLAEHGQPFVSKRPCVKVLSAQRHVRDHIALPAMFTSLVHVPTTLVEYWFTHICPMWSTFDSTLNYNRQLAATAHSDSAAVSYTLQYMSAAQLSRTSPWLGTLAVDLLAQAATSIREMLTQVQLMNEAKVEPALMFAVLGIGTSVQWVDCDEEFPWFDRACTLLDRWASTLSPAEAFLHAYFKQALTYWRLLQIISKEVTAHPCLEQKRSRMKMQLHQELGLSDGTSSMSGIDVPEMFGGTRPNSWCGVSSPVVEIFAEVLVLCRSFERRQHADLTFASTCEDIVDISVAKQLQSQLMDMDFHHIVTVDEFLGFAMETGDALTPIAHLIQTAEAYRLASLLQLCIYFDDLEAEVVIPSINIDSTDQTAEPSDQEHVTARPRKLILMAVQLVKVLESIPVESRSKTIHPMLYLAAAAGLRCPADPWLQTSQNVPTAPESQVLSSPIATNLSTSFCLRQDSFSSSLGQRTMGGTPFTSQSIFEIARCRNVILSRLEIFKNNLPTRPVEMLSKFIGEIWSEFDRTTFSTSLRWLHLLDRSAF